MWYWSEKVQVVTSGCDQKDHDAARKDVAEQPQRERDGLHRLFDDVERYEQDAERDRQLERLRETPKVPVPPLHPDAVPLDDQKHDQPHRERLVPIRVGGVQCREDAERKELEPVRHKDEKEQRQG